MANFKRKKRQKTHFRPYESWEHACEKFSDHRNRMAAEYAVNPPKQRSKRSKKRKIRIVFRPRAGVHSWFFREEQWNTWRRYARLQDAERAIKALTRPSSWWNKRYIFKIDESSIDKSDKQ